MSECEVCSSALARERKARIDGILFMVCERCLELGTEVPVSIRPARKEAPKPKPIVDEDLVLAAGFGEMIRREREKRGLSQEELASKIGEKASVIRRAEHGMEPEEREAKKLERFLGIKLYEKQPLVISKAKEEKSILTLGDVAEIKRK